MNAILINDQSASITEVRGLEFESETITADCEDPWIELRLENPAKFLVLEIDIPETYTGDRFTIHHSFASDSPLPSYTQEKSYVLPFSRGGHITRIIEFEFPISFTRIDITESAGNTGISSMSVNAFGTLEESLRHIIGDQHINNNGIIVSTHDLSNTGAPHLAFHIAKSLYERQIPVIVIACDEGNAALLDSYEKESLPIISFDTLQSSVYTDARSPIKIQKICDALHNIGFRSALLNTLLSARYAEYYKYAGHNTISLIHETAETIEIQDWIDLAIDAATFSDYMVFPSDAVSQEFLGLVQRIEGKALIRPQGVYQESIQADSIEFSDIGIGSDEIVILGSGNCTLRKGYDLFVASAIELQSASPDSSFKFIWTGDFGDTFFDRDYKMRLEAQVKKSMVSDNFIRMSFCAPSEYKALLNRANLFWCTSRDDTFPSVVLEAMLARIPVVAFGSTGGVDTMLHEGRGKLVPGFDISAFANDSISLLENSDQCTQITTAAFSWVHDNLNFGDYIQWLISLTKQPALINPETCLDLRIRRIRNLASIQTDIFEFQDNLREIAVDEGAIGISAAEGQDVLTSPEIKKALTHILEAFDQLCRKENLRYSLSGGTLLGAIRHGGFIPWDDDIDLLMPRDDYEKLLALPFPFDIDGITIDLKSNRNSSQPSVYAKIIDPSILVYEPDKKTIGNLWIDIVPFEFMPETGFAQSDLQKARELNLEAWDVALSLESLKGRKKRQAESRITALTNEIESMYSKEGSGGTTVAELAWSNFFGGGKIKAYSSSLFDDLVQVEFEQRKYPAFRVWNDFLIRQYGEYWIVPREADQRNHSIVAWRTSHE